VVISDEVLRLVRGVADNILRHVHACGICVLGLNRILPVSPHAGDRVPENQLLKSPLAQDRSVVILKSCF